MDKTGFIGSQGGIDTTGGIGKGTSDCIEQTGKI